MCVGCHAQGELLHFERNVFLCGAAKSAPDLVVEPGAVTYWTSGQGTGLDRMRGNIGAVIFRVGSDTAELLLIFHLSRSSAVDQCVGCRLAGAGGFSALDDKEICKMMENASVLHPL